MLLGWVFFRAPSLDSALEYLRGMLSLHGGHFGIPLPIILFLAAAVIGQWTGFTSIIRRVVPPRTVREYALVGAAAVVAVMLIPVQIPNFIYFQF